MQSTLPKKFSSYVFTVLFGVCALLMLVGCEPSTYHKKAHFTATYPEVYVEILDACDVYVVCYNQRTFLFTHLYQDFRTKAWSATGKEFFRYPNRPEFVRESVDKLFRESGFLQAEIPAND